MGFLQLPTILFSDISKKDRGTLIWDSAKNQVFKALQEYGCFEASFDGVSPDLRESVFASLKQLFDLPLETKVRNVPDKIFNGYIGLAEEVPIYESLGIEDPEIFSNIMWPDGNRQFCDSMQAYTKMLTEVDEIVRMMVLESLNLEKHMDEHMELTSSLVRVNKYRMPEKDESDMGLLSHADKNVVTILHQNEVGGLEVQTKDEEWFKVKFSPNSFVVMAGESFNAWTNGRIHAATHRVVTSGEKDRFTIGVFSVPKWEKTIKAPEEMVDEEHPLLFNPFHFGDFLQFLCKKEIVNDKFALKKYCGVSV
ncbi:probable 2-oxoglutarate-dependent dioxygenase AOP1 [Cynara cardunculus var. scolymus]|uniref:probable 2-oxoglutarate-dependent dioxygenase AOP1 n=1 Tax=Cynara cardunculus var. scolymus TaxID=59895 RepID=UPI000D62B6F3|nr:probable 2-oxoglutarate-dependent dioxygenase AOP1 [Cynara cardunculus var. scolymus]